MRRWRSAATHRVPAVRGASTSTVTGRFEEGGRPCLIAGAWPRTSSLRGAKRRGNPGAAQDRSGLLRFARNDEMGELRSEEHTSELQSLMRISYAVFCLKKQNDDNHHHT